MYRYFFFLTVSGLLSAMIHAQNDSNSFTCGDRLTDARDGQVYMTVLIGSQCWMAQNLNAGTRVDAGTPTLNNGIIEKYCYIDKEDSCRIYGGLYRWDEMMQYDTVEGVRGICPGGWHVPTNGDWCTMMMSMDTMVKCDKLVFSGKDIGDLLKQAGTRFWSAPNTGATDASGFNALAAGRLQSSTSKYNMIKRIAFFWTSTQHNTEQALDWVLRNDHGDIFHFYPLKIDGLSVRCIKD
jgi:uncharacterized protein (TIGR02145 family)